MKYKKNIRLKSTNGFTLVELLVVITIVAVLASLAFVAAQRGLIKASASKSLSRIRQSGSMLLADAQDRSGKLQYSVDSNPGSAGWDLLPYNIVRYGLGMNLTSSASTADICEIMHWDSAKLKPLVYHRNCFGVNFTNIPEVVTWIEEVIPEPESYKVKSLVLAAIVRPEAYPILIDSSDSKGNEIFQILESNGDFVGLRNSGKAHGYFLDGSARELSPSDLKSVGFTKIYDNSVRPPKVRSL